MADKVDERTLQQTSTWAVAVVCFFLLLISIVIEKLIHKLGTCFKRKNKKALYEALEKVKAELMLMGFISLLLTIGQNYISQICISESIAASMRPCSKSEELKEYPPKNKDTGNDEGDEENSGRKLLELVESFIPRRSLATKGYDKCAEKGKVAFVSSYGMHQLHIFIFVLAVCHVIYCIVTYALGKIKVVSTSTMCSKPVEILLLFAKICFVLMFLSVTQMRRWKRWEEETKTIEYQYSHDPERFRFARDTSFGRRHLNFWSKSTITLWIACFFRQFFGSVTRVDYLTLRHGFIMYHSRFREEDSEKKKPSAVELPAGPGIIRTQHEISTISLRDFSFKR
ncbi:hypothetical protein F2Q68_00025639 [Brassica cretica]|uniref:MLO-like protein n=1 Tax=Brassica cretica TaxID=69181 RepID=A0A8S9I731_BRACR|nr:hypothetical protein F2Q68_00025639 [Brassica cretica]